MLGKILNILNTQSRILSPIHNLIWPEAIQPIRFSKDHRCFSCGLQQRGMCVTQRPSVSDVPKGTLYHHLIFKGLGRGSGELCHRLASTQTHTEGGFGPASRNQRSLGRHPGLDPPPTRPRRTGRVPAHAARHQWADPPPFLSLSLSPSLLPSSTANPHHHHPSTDCLPICFLASAWRRGWDLNST